MTDFAIQVLTAPIGKTHLFSVGQAGFIIKSAGGQLLAVDLYLSDCVERVEGNAGFKRLLPKILFPADLQFDAVVATHFHRDHFDIDAVPSLMSNEKTKLFAAEDCRESVKQLEMTDRNITYVKTGMTCECGDFTLEFVDCDHGTGAPLAVGVIVKVDRKIIFETGDTCLRLDRVDKFKTHGMMMDQMDNILFELKNTPYSRRMITSIYNHSELSEMNLYPCCWSLTFNVTDEGYDKLVLNCVLNQRSNDVLAANNWNVVQYSALLMMIAQSVNMIPGVLLHVIADAHIYDRHIPIVEELIKREQYPAPTVILDKDITDFYKFTEDSFTIENYKTGEQVKNIPIAV